MKRGNAVPVVKRERSERPQSYNHLIENHCLRDCVICVAFSSMQYLMRAAAVRGSANEDGEDGEVSEEATQLATAAAKRIKREHWRGRHCF